jgi:5'/3'-nucleotidase
MRILLTNDDGIRAPGIRAMYRQLVHLADEVLVVAPLTVQSATSHAITYETPLMTEEVPVHTDSGSGASVLGIAVDGRPADCTKLAVKQLWAERFGAGSKPDLVVSGLNAGANIGINTLYSGTVAAALEAAFLGIPAVAVSLMIGESARTRWDQAARHACRAIDLLLRDGPPRAHTMLNINVPVTESETDFPGMVVGPVNLFAHRDDYEARQSPIGQPYYWAVGDGMVFHDTSGGSDVEIIQSGKISVTPMNYDLTDHAALASYEARITNAQAGSLEC